MLSACPAALRGKGGDLTSDPVNRPLERGSFPRNADNYLVDEKPHDSLATSGGEWSAHDIAFVSSCAITRGGATPSAASPVRV